MMKKWMPVICCLSILLLCALCTACVSAAADVRYVCDAGNDRNDGLTAASPLKTLAACGDDLPDGGTVVVCGPLTLSGDALKLPKVKGQLSFTSVYDGTDYAKTNAAILNLGGFTYLGSDAAFEDIRIHDASALYFNYLVCRGHNLTVGDRVTCTRDYGEYITILGGQYIDSDSMTAAEVSFYDYTIKIGSGLWFMVNGSNKRTASESAMGATGGVHIVIEGGSFTGKAENQADAMISAGGYASQDGDYSIEISGGIFNTPIIAIARPGNNSGRYTAYYEGDVDIRITGGQFRGAVITTVQSEAASYIGGDYRLQISGGQFPNLVSIAPLRVRGSAACDVPNGLRPLADGFDLVGELPEKQTKTVNLPAGDGVVFVGKGGAGDGKNANAPLPTPESAVAALGEGGGTVVVTTPLRVGSVALPQTSGRLTVTSVYGGVDFREICGAKLELTGHLTLGGETLFENVDFEARSLAACIYCDGHKTVFGDGIRCTRHMDGGVTEYIGIFTGSRLWASSDEALGKSPADLTVRSGDWRFLRAGNDRAQGGEKTLRTVNGDSILRLYGGNFHEFVTLTGKNNQSGNITAEITGGKFLCSIYGLSSPADVDNDVNRVDGNITLNISGGEFHGDVAPAQNPDKNALNGAFTLQITGGDFRAVGSLRGTAGLRGANSSALYTKPDFHAPTSGEMTFENPIIGYGADPSVLFYDGWYYYARPAAAGGRQVIRISRSANLCDIGATTPVTVFVGDAALKSIWAPQVYCFDGSFYIYFSGCDSTSASAKRTPYILKADTADPLGSYTMLGQPQNLDPGIYSWLSPRVFDYKGERYYISSVFVNAEDNTSAKHLQTMVIGKLSAPDRFAGGVTAIAVPDKSWEGYDIMEGPFPVCGKDGALYIAYAANYADGEDYCTGLLKLVGDDLCEASSWEKLSRPMQQRDDDNLIFAPGAAVFAPAPVGDKVYAIYHVKLHANNRFNRSIFVQELAYKDGVPYLGAPPALESVHTYPLNPMPVSARIVGFTGIAAAGDEDINGDGVLSLADVIHILKCAAGVTAAPHADVSRDGHISVYDAVLFLRKLLG